MTGSSYLSGKQLLCGTYQPQPVRGVEIWKPDGGVRKLGIPKVLDQAGSNDPAGSDAGVDRS
jgi:retron-type reverse transcriptase